MSAGARKASVIRTALKRSCADTDPSAGRTGVTTSDFSEGWSQFAYCQEILQKAWKKDAACLTEIEAQLEVLDVTKTKMESGRFVLETLKFVDLPMLLLHARFLSGKRPRSVKAPIALLLTS